MSEAGKGEAGGEKMTKAGREKERRTETGVMESGMYFFENLFLNIYLC